MDDHPVLLEDEYLAAARTLAVNALTRARLDADDAAAKELLAKVLAEGETGVNADGLPMVRVQPGALVFDERTAREHLDAASIAAIEVTETTTRLDRQRAKDILAPALYALACKQNKPSIRVL